MNISVEEFYEHLAKAALPVDAPQDDALALMIILHTHHLQVSRSVTLTDLAPGRVTLTPITRQHAASVVAGCYPASSALNSRNHWAAMYGSEIAVESSFEVSEKWSAPIERLKSKIVKSGFVSDFIQE